jgi:exodeoxyribonuclease VII large subunit
VSGAGRRTERGRLQLESTAGKLNALSPLATLDRGYTIVRSADRRTLRSVNDVTPGDDVEVVFRDGSAAATVARVTPNADSVAGPTATATEDL